MAMCFVDGCFDSARANGLCNKHLIRRRLTGTTAPGARAHAPIEERFGRHFNKSESDKCWLWTGSRNKHGYGLISVGAKGAGQLLAHRVAWEIANGLMPDGDWVVMHSCDTPACVNPTHLKLGTQADNMRDMFSKDRANPINRPQGSDHHATELTDDDVRDIRASNLNCVVLGRQYGLHKTSIAKIRSRKTWKHLS